MKLIIMRKYMLNLVEILGYSEWNPVQLWTLLAKHWLVIGIFIFVTRLKISREIKNIRTNKRTVRIKSVLMTTYWLIIRDYAIQNK